MQKQKIPKKKEHNNSNFIHQSNTSRCNQISR